MRIQRFFLYLIFIFSSQVSYGDLPPAAPVAPTVQTPLLIETPHDTFESSFVKMLLTLGGLLALIFLTLWILRRFSHGRIGGFGSKKIKILEKRPLSPKSVLYLVEVDRKQVLLSESQFEVRPVLNLFEAEEE